jgi:hypothetical protein
MMATGGDLWPLLTGVAINRAGKAQEELMNTRRFSVNGQANTSVADRVRKASDAIRPVLDQINKGFAEAEKRLRALHPVRDIWFCYLSIADDPMHPDCPPYVHYCIGIAKHQGEWRLCWGTDHDCNDGGVLGVQPVADTSRRVRVEVAKELSRWFPELQERIAKAEEDFLPEAKEALANMMAGLGQI